MKVLSVQQPWATMICSGIKDVENRTWKPKENPGRILIHASKKFSMNMLGGMPLEWASTINNDILFGNLPQANEFPYGAIIGYVTLDRIETESDSLWASPDESQYKWVLKDAYMFDKPIEGVKGKLHLFDYSIDENNLPAAHKVEISMPKREGDELVVPLSKANWDEYATTKDNCDELYLTLDIAPVSDEMIVIGERLSQENVAEPEEKKPEGSEPAATEPAVFKPAVSEPEESEFATSELETKESEVPAQNEVESVVSDEENESTLTEKTPIAEKVPSDEENSITEIPIVEEASIEEEASSDEETPSSDEETDKRHVVLPRYLVIAASVVFLAMIGGFGWFAFNYGKMAAQRDHLALQLDNYQQIAAEKKAPAKSAPTQEEILRKKAIEDSVRMAQASKAVKKAENAEQNMDAAVDKQSIDVKSAEAKKNLEVKKLADAKNLADAKRQVDAKKLAETKKQQETKKLAEAKKKEETRKQAEKHAAQASSIRSYQNLLSDRYLRCLQAYCPLPIEANDTHLHLLSPNPQPFHSKCN